MTETKSDIHLLELAVERNAKYGLQLSQQDKQDVARRIYHITPVKEREEKKKFLAKILSVPERTVRDWLSRIDKDEKVARNKRIFDLWLACYTQEEIAEIVGWPRRTITRWLSFGQNPESEEMAKTPSSDEESGESPIQLTKAQLADADHATEFDVPIYNVWKQQEEIAEREGIHKETVSQVCQEMAELPKSDKPRAEHRHAKKHGCGIGVPN